MDIFDFFSAPTHSLHRQYEALRAFFIEKRTAEEVAKQFNYKKSTVYSLARDFGNQVKNNTITPTHFFHEIKPGRKPTKHHNQIRDLIILLRKKYLSVPDIKSILDTQGQNVSERHI